MRNRWVRRVAPWTAGGLLLVAGGGLAYAQTRPAAPAYRTATVQSGSVSSQLTVTGLVHVVNQARAALPVAGTVLSAPVQVGQHVAAGQVLATIDTTALRAGVVGATATLAKAQETLQTDRSAVTAAAAPTTTVAPAAKATTQTTGSRPASSTALTQALAAVRQQTSSAQTALAAAAAACGTRNSTAPATGPARGGPRSSPTGTPTQTPQASPTDSPAAGASPSPSDSASPAVDPTACLTSLQQAMKAQQALARSQTTASSLLAKSSSSAGGASSSTTKRAATGVTAISAAISSATVGAGRSGSSGGGGVSSPAARVTLDTAAVSAAQVALTTAQQALAGARLTSPLTGTVASQPFTVGQAASTGQAIVVIGAGQVQVTANAPAAAVPTLRVGELAQVTPDGSRTPVQGTVTQVGLLPVAAANGALTYPVTVLVQQPGTAFHDGGGASVGIQTKTVQAALVVPDSALVNGAVTVVRAGKLVPTRVQVGVVGPLTAQVLSGLQKGEFVLLADPTKALPANSTTPARTFGGGAGAGLGTGAGGGGGRGPAGPPGG